MEMNLLYNSNFAQNLDYLYSTLNNLTRSFIADDQTKLFQTQSATIVSLEEVSAKRLNWAVWGCSVNWVIVVSSCIVGRFWVLHGFFNRLIRGHRKLGHRCVQLHCGKVLGLPSPLIGYEVAQETGSLLCRVALWEGFECAIASLIGCYEVAEETGSKSSPETVSLNQFDTTRTQFHAPPAKMADSHLLLFYLTTFSPTPNIFSSANQPHHGACKVL